MVSNETHEMLEYFFKKYLPDWFRDEFNQKISRWEIEDDYTLVKEFLKSFYMSFIQPLEFMRTTLLNLRVIDTTIEFGKIELVDNLVLIKQSSIDLTGNELDYEEIDKFIIDFKKMIIENIGESFLEFGWR